MKKETDAEKIYLLHLLNCALKEVQPCEKPDVADYNELFQLAKFHSVANLAYYAIERLEQQPEAKLQKEWSEIRDMAVVKSLNQLTERDQIITALTRAEIRILPLKGCYIKEMYPQIDMRMMADLDILIHPGQAHEAKNVMESLGYQTELFAHSNHDVYSKPPVMEVELHTHMFRKNSPYYDYYETIWEKAGTKHENLFLYELSWDDFYVFLITHLAKHYYCGGSGIRSIMDIDIFLKAHQDDIHEEYIRKELEILNLWEFKQEVETIAARWFADNDKITALNRQEEYILSSGTYGTKGNDIENNVLRLKGNAKTLKKAKIKYLLCRIFMNKKEMKKNYKILNKFPFLLPFLWIYRLIHALIKKRKKVIYEYRKIRKTQN